MVYIHENHKVIKQLKIINSTFGLHKLVRLHTEISGTTHLNYTLGEVTRCKKKVSMGNDYADSNNEVSYRLKTLSELASSERLSMTEHVTMLN